MKQATGECKYCGQLKSVSVADDATQEEINEIVTGTCTCEDAKYQAGITRIIKSTESKIDMLFESDNESPEKCLLKKAAPILVNGFIKGITISLEDSISYKMTIKDATVTVERKQVITDRAES